MRLRILLVSLMAAAAWVSGASAQGARCGPSKAHTLAADGLVRVYAQGEKVFGCAKGAHSHYVLGSTSNSAHEGRVGPIAVAGVNVAFGRTYFGVDMISANVVVENLTDGRLLRNNPATTGDFGPETAQHVYSIVVKPDSSVAWIATINSLIRHEGTTEVKKSDSTQRTTLDSGPSIKPDSLRLHRSPLSWRDSSATKTATLR